MTGIKADDCTTCGKSKAGHYGGIHCRGYPTYRPLSELLVHFDELNNGETTPAQRGYRMGSETTALLIASWLKVVAHARDDRGHPEECQLLLEAAGMVERGEFRTTQERREPPLPVAAQRITYERGFGPGDGDSKVIEP